MKKSIMVNGGKETLGNFVSLIGNTWGFPGKDYLPSPEGIRELLTDISCPEDPNWTPDISYTEEGGSTTLRWNGGFTPGRYIEVVAYPNGTACIEVETGTEQPSSFFGRSSWLREFFPELCEVETNYVAVIGHTGVVEVREDTSEDPGGQYRIQYRCLPRFKEKTREYLEAISLGDRISNRELGTTYPENFKIRYTLFDGSGFWEIIAPKGAWFDFRKLSDVLAESLPEGDITFAPFGAKMIMVSVGGHTHGELRIM